MTSYVRLVILAMCVAPQFLDAMLHQANPVELSYGKLICHGLRDGLLAVTAGKCTGIPAGSLAELWCICGVSTGLTASELMRQDTRNVTLSGALVYVASSLVPIGLYVHWLLDQRMKQCTGQETLP